MAKDVTNDLTWYLCLPASEQANLGAIRQWNNLKAGYDQETLWVKGFDYAQINAVEVKCIPMKSLFYEQGGKLYPQGSLLPSGQIPSVLWTPIDRVFLLKFPSLNHNYFGVHEKLQINLVTASQEQEVAAMITSVEKLGRFLESAPAVRLKKMQWALLNTDEVLILGKPVLPIPGQVFWVKRNLVIPAGFDFELFLLDDLVSLQLSDAGQWIIWNTDGTYFPVEKSDLQPLSLGSFRLTMQTETRN